MSDQQQNPQEPKRRRLFARTRARIEEFEKSNDDVRGIVEHFKTHRNAYLASAGCLALGFVVGKHRQRPINVDVKTVINNAQEAAELPLPDGAVMLLADSVVHTLKTQGSTELVLEDGTLVQLINNGWFS